MSLIALMDCNNFFVSCERLFRPDLIGKPVAVLSSNDGVIVARSQEVKAMGVPMGLPLFQAKKLVDMSDVSLFSSNFALYRDISSRVMQILAVEVGKCEVYSIDEAFFKLPADTTEEDLLVLRNRIIKLTGIPVTVGAASTKTLAKVASELGKKGRGTMLLNDSKWQGIATDYPAGEVWNLGRATAVKLRDIGVTTAASFMALDTNYVNTNFGIAGRRIQDELKGITVHKLEQNSDSLRQSIASTRSFATVTKDISVLESALSYHVIAIGEKLRQKKLCAGKLYIEARASRHSDFSHKKGWHEVPLMPVTNETSQLLKAALSALSYLFDPQIPYKKVGVTASALVPLSIAQHSLFSTLATNEGSIDKVTDSLNRRFGGGTIRPATILDSGSRTSAALRSKSYTTVWKDIPRVQAK